MLRCVANIVIIKTRQSSLSKGDFNDFPLRPLVRVRTHERLVVREVRPSRGSDKEFARRSKLIARKNDVKKGRGSVGKSLFFLPVLFLILTPIPFPRRSRPCL